MRLFRARLSLFDLRPADRARTEGFVKPAFPHSALHHRHSRQDEFVFVLEGEPTLVTDAGEEVLRPGMCAGFRAGGTAHHLVSRSGGDVVYLEVGNREGRRGEKSRGRHPRRLGTGRQVALRPQGWAAVLTPGDSGYVRKSLAAAGSSVFFALKADVASPARVMNSGDWWPVDSGALVVVRGWAAAARSRS